MSKIECAVFVLMAVIFSLSFPKESEARIEENRYLEYCIPSYEYTCVSTLVHNVWKESDC